jgi:hypothetical protein
MKHPLLLIVTLGAVAPAGADIVPPKPLLADVVPEPGDTPTFDAAPFALRREAGSPASEGGLYRAIIDPTIYRHSGSDFESLRLVRERNGVLEELPWRIRRIPTPPQPPRPGPIRHRIESFNQGEDGSIEFVVVLADGSPAPGRLEISTPLQDFEKSLTVSVASEEGTWSVLVGDGVVFDHSRYLDFRQTGITLPNTPSRRFRIRLAEATDEQRSRVREITRTVSDAAGVTLSESGRVETRDFRIDELRFHAAPPKTEPRRNGGQSHELTVLSRETTPAGETVIVLDGGRIPLERLEFATESRNFKRPVSVQVPDTSGSWRAIGQGFLHRYEIGDFREESLALSFPETRAERYRVVVGNGKNPPVTLIEVTGAGEPRELVFLAESGDRPILLYDDPSGTLTKPSPDTAAIDAALGRGIRPATIVFAEAAANPVHRAAEPPSKPLLESQKVLWIVIALAVAILIRVLYGALRKIDAAGGEGGDPA